MSSISILRLYTFLNNYYVPKPVIYEVFDKIFFTHYKDNLYKFFYFKVFDSRRNMFKQVVPLYYFNWYVNLNLGFFSKNDQSFGSKTLLLDRNYFYSRFINFKKN